MMLEDTLLDAEEGVYYLDKNGAMVTGWVNLGTEEYPGWGYAEDSGVLVVERWKKIDNKWYYFNGAFRVEDTTLEIDSKTYRFDKNGVMVTGWYQENEIWYYYGTDGAMVNGWQKINGKWYYFEDYKMISDVTKDIGGKPYHFESSGAMSIGWFTTEGLLGDIFWYYADANGVVQAGWQKINNKW